MSDSSPPVLHLIVGVDGAGKSTFYYRRLEQYLDGKFGGLPFANADEIQRGFGSAANPKDSYRAAEPAAEERVQLRAKTSANNALGRSLYA